MAVTVSEKSTKADIWAAYRDLLAAFQSGSSKVATSDTKLEALEQQLSSARDDLARAFESALESVKDTASTQHEAQDALVKRKADIVAELEKSRADLQASIDDARKQWEIEKTDTLRLRDREAEEYTYELIKKRRDEQADYAAKHQQKVDELAAREAALKDRETTADELQKLVDSAPAQLEAAVKAALDTQAKELKASYETEIRTIKQAAEHDKNILELRLQTAQTAIADRDKQLNDLHTQLETTSAQLKDMAVTVIRSASASTHTPPPTTET